MTPGHGNTSYALNSEYQKMLILKTKLFVEEAITDLYCKSFPTKSLTIADLGCSSGPNSLLVISEIIEAVDSKCRTLVRTYVRPSKQRTISVWGRTYAVSTYVPPGIENNKGHVYIAATSPPSVHQAYFTQFQRDFKLFLSSRSQEITTGGRMVITRIGRRNLDSFSEECWDGWELLAKSLGDMVSEGHIEEAKLDSFNLPWYAPSLDEVRAAIQDEKSFHLNLVEIMDDSRMKDMVGDKLNNGPAMARFMRAVTESMLVSHFGDKILEDLFHKFAEYLNGYLKEHPVYINLVMTMTKKS
ncbi:hypothetical protein AQUCO_03300129v1 [Aquilegia coerulea]|uniref:Jasmonate O-methyltransferase n=1 Tax=Aquilegia coerulea TaxID=218851 RepID=A0A2G5D0J4_AQUCA|nr:hypothetical protein AQUCO_03300129v1 [Aquilegia coerulea]